MMIYEDMNTKFITILISYVRRYLTFGNLFFSISFSFVNKNIIIIHVKTTTSNRRKNKNFENSIFVKFSSLPHKSHPIVYTVINIYIYTLMILKSNIVK